MYFRTLLLTISVVAAACNGAPDGAPAQEDSRVSAEGAPTSSFSTPLQDDAVPFQASGSSPPDSMMGATQQGTLPPGCMPIMPPPSGSGDPRIVFQTWCRRDPATVFEAWLAGNHGVGTYGPRWATEVCPDESPWHSELLGHFLQLPLQRAYLQRLFSERIQRGITDCEDPRVVEWLRAALATDLAPDLHALLVTMALSLDRPEWDSLVLEISANGNRDADTRIRALEEYLFSRVEVEEVPALIAEGYASQRLPRGFITKWVPALLARTSTREDMATRGIDALVADPSRELVGELAWVLFTEMGAYSYRFPESLLQRADAALQEIAQDRRRTYPFREAFPRIEAARRDSLNAEGRRIRRVPWEFTADRVDGTCVPVWPDRLRAFAEGALPGLSLLSRQDECPGPHRVGDFDADGRDDVVMMSVLDGREVWILVLGGEEPQAIEVSGVLGYDQAYPVDAGWYAAACAGTGWMPWNGFAISLDEKSSAAYYVRDGRLVEQPMAVC